MIDTKYIQHIAEQLELSPTQVAQAIELITGGATIPFISRYRRDVTGNLNETQLEAIAERNIYFTALTDRCNYLLKTAEEQGVLSDKVKEILAGCYDKTVVEDLCLPFRKKRRTKATIAQEKGLAPLADFLWHQALLNTNIEVFAASFALPEKAVLSPEEALDGACHVLAERLSMDHETRSAIRTAMLKEGVLKAHATKNAEGKKTKYANYHDFSESIHAIPSHRFLAVMRGVNEGVLRVELLIDDETLLADTRKRLVKEPGSAFEPYISRVIQDAYNHLLRPAIENEVMGIIRQRAEEEAIRVFRENARNILLAPPLGARPAMGMEASGDAACVLAVIDAEGVFQESATVSLKEEDRENAENALLAIMERQKASAVAVGNGTHAREIAAFVRRVLGRLNAQDALCVLISEAGAAAYGNSKLAKEELPELDMGVRRAVSIARRLQDPLAELVKIDPRHIGVGQYQHDVNQKHLRETLHRTVASCVNEVGVTLNAATAALLGYVSGIQQQTAGNIVAKRTELGGFKRLEQLTEVEGVGPKVYEQSVGFLRLLEGENPLDATCIHPEAYPVVAKLAEAVGKPVEALIGDAKALDALDLAQFEEGVIGPQTLQFIKSELAKPSRDPRTVFRAPRFLENVHSIEDLADNMVLEGVVTNVTDFGVFVDIGVSQDGLVHLSELANRFVRDPRTVAKVGDVVRVKVLKVDKELPRVSLSMKALLSHPESRPANRRRRPARDAAAPQTAEAAAATAQTGSEAPRETHGGPRPEQRPPRPERERPPRKAERKQDGKRRGAPARPPKEHATFGNASGPLNTQLAEQLAALRDKLGS